MSNYRDCFSQDNLFLRFFFQDAEELTEPCEEILGRALRLEKSSSNVDPEAASMSVTINRWRMPCKLPTKPLVFL